MGHARFWTLLLVLSVAAEVTYAQTCSATDSTALLYFSRELWQVGNAFTTWQEGTNCCQWAGVTCNGGGRVIGLTITQADIPTAPPAGEPYVICSGLGDLGALESLNMTNIGLNGKLPTTLGGLSSLQTMVIDGCNLIGPIPAEFCKLSKLSTLVLRNNLLDSYPSCIDSLGSITTIDLTNNKFGGAPKRP